MVHQIMIHDKKAERGVAVASFVSAVALAFTGLAISPEHNIEGGVLIMCAQFLTLTATIFGIDYKFSNYGITSRHKKQ